KRKALKKSLKKGVS
ncbi:hypothetical protein HPF55_0955, partial [Helicobacter pylori]